MSNIDNLLNEPFILTEGAIIERLEHEFHISLDSELLNAILVSDTDRRHILKNIYKEYIDVATKSGVPILIFTPTWKVNIRSCKNDENILALIIRDCSEFMCNIRDEYSNFDKIYIGGLIGVINDSYKASLSLAPSESYSIHKKTVKQFLRNRRHIDFLIASTLPSLSEALGIARAMSDSKIPYILSFVIRKDGRILDESLFSDIIEQIDNSVENLPICYMINCSHPKNVQMGLENILDNITDDKKKYLLRIRGIQGNTSKLSPEELDNSTETYKENPSSFANEMYKLKNIYNFNILGGCCGTNKSHISSIAELFKRNSH